MSTEYVDLASPALNLFSMSYRLITIKTMQLLKPINGTDALCCGARHFDAHMTKNYIVEPHWHPNTTELYRHAR